ncbi:MAG: Phosphate transport system permease protein PstC [Firmicutes bacterium]|nr:Phosphate transport system permease protein PstC [Bacillota bacterium]
MQAVRRALHSGTREGVFHYVTLLAALGLVALAVSIFLVVTLQSAPAWRAFGLSFLTTSIWDPMANQFGAVPALLGTVITAVLALAVATPLSIGTAVFLSEIVPQNWRRPLSFVVELLAAVPSVVYGLWGLFVLAPWLRTGLGQLLADSLGFLPIFAGPSLGIGVLTASLVLAIMVLPTITAISGEVMRGVPTELREAMFALGATRWEVVTKVILPSSKSGIAGALLLGLGRAIGEAIAVTMVIGNANLIPASLLAPAQTMASLIVNEFPEAFDLHLSALLLLATLLFIITLIINLIAAWFFYRPSQDVAATAKGSVWAKLLRKGS